jgi:hypothetical protein
MCVCNVRMYMLSEYAYMYVFMYISNLCMCVLRMCGVYQFGQLK